PAHGAAYRVTAQFQVAGILVAPEKKRSAGRRRPRRVSRAIPANVAGRCCARQGGGMVKMLTRSAARLRTLAHRKKARGGGTLHADSTSILGAVSYASANRFAGIEPYSAGCVRSGAHRRVRTSARAGGVAGAEDDSRHRDRRHGRYHARESGADTGP